MLLFFCAMKLAKVRFIAFKVSLGLMAKWTFVSHVGGKTVIEYFQAVVAIKGQLITAFGTLQKSFF